MYGGGPETRGGDSSIATARITCAVEGVGTDSHANRTGVGAARDEAFTSVACSSTRGPDSRQQSDALSFIGHCWWPCLQQAICWAGAAAAPSAHVAHADVSTPDKTISETVARTQRPIRSLWVALAYLSTRAGLG